MTSHDAELSRNMDRITQLQDGIDNLVTIMYSTLSFLSRKAEFRQVNPDIPITQTIPEATNPDGSRENFKENCEELVQDFMRKAKQVEYLISILPQDKSQLKTTSANLLRGSIDQADRPTQLSSDNPISSSMPIEPNAAPGEPSLPQKSNDASVAAPIELPEISEDVLSDQDEFEPLENDIHVAQAEYEQALAVANELHSEVQLALRKILDDRCGLYFGSTKF